MPRIFISYRRADSITISGRIYDRLAAAFGEGNVFKDVDDIPFGADFRAVLEREVATCDAQLVIIGQNWLNATDDHGAARLLDPNDFVRIEVESGLKRSNNILVIPVLVSGAKMPAPDQLPGSLAELPYRNAAVVRDDPDFNRDMVKLIEQIKQHFTALAAGTTATLPTRARLPSRPNLDFPEIRWTISTRRVAFAGIVLVLLALFALVGSRLISNPDGLAATGTPTDALSTGTPAASPEPTAVPAAVAPNFWLTYPVAQNVFEITHPFDAPMPEYEQIAPDKLPRNEGVNIAAADAQGNPSTILAAQRGVVEFVNEDADHPYGNYVRLRHTWYGEDWVTWYGHLGSIAVEEGQFVAAGTPLGGIGSTGSSTGNTLKFVVQHIGAGLDDYVIDDVVDPQPLFTVNPPAYDEAWLIEDVSIPAGTELEVGAAFTKTWRVINTGTRTWDRAYRLRRVEGEAFGMTDDAIRALQDIVFLRPGDVTDLTLALVAPDQPGSYRAAWQLTNGAGVRFDPVLTVDIVVVERVVEPSLTPTEDRGYDLLRYVVDVTTPDGTVFSPGEAFTKTWRVRNGGTTTWGEGYALVFVEGDRMGGATAIPLAAAVPGGTIEMTVYLTAPNRPGAYRGYWQARNPEGQLFGSQLFVDIRVE